MRKYFFKVSEIPGNTEDGDVPSVLTQLGGVCFHSSASLPADRVLFKLQFDPVHLQLWYAAVIPHFSCFHNQTNQLCSQFLPLSQVENISSLVHVEVKSLCSYFPSVEETFQLYCNQPPGGLFWSVHVCHLHIKAVTGLLVLKVYFNENTFEFSGLRFCYFYLRTTLKLVPAAQ